MDLNFLRVVFFAYFSRECKWYNQKELTEFVVATPNTADYRNAFPLPKYYAIGGPGAFHAHDHFAWLWTRRRGGGRECRLCPRPQFLPRPARPAGAEREFDALRLGL